MWKGILVIAILLAALWLEQEMARTSCELKHSSSYCEDKL